MMNGLIGTLAPGMCRIGMNGRIAVKTNTGYKTFDLNKNRMVNCDQFAIDVGTDMFFVMPTNRVKRGDLILVGGKPYTVLGVDGDMVKVVNYETNAIETILPERHMFMGNMYFFSQIKSPFGTGKKGGANIAKMMVMSEMMKRFTGGTTSTSGGMGGMNGFAGLACMSMMFGVDGNMFTDMFDGMSDDFNLFDDEDDCADATDSDGSEDK